MQVADECYAPRGQSHASVSDRAADSPCRWGWEMFAQARNCLAAIEQEWTAHLGGQRFKALRDSLHDLSLWFGKLT